MAFRSAGRLGHSSSWHKHGAVARCNQGSLLKPAARPDCYVARCSESSCTRMYTAVPAPHMDVQVSREAGCRKRPLRAPCTRAARDGFKRRSEEHTSELQSQMRSSYAVFCLKK